MLSRSVMSDSLQPHGLCSSAHGDTPGKNTGVGCHTLLQGIFPTQGSNPGLQIAGGFFAIWATREALIYINLALIYINLCIYIYKHLCIFIFVSIK